MINRYWGHLHTHALRKYHTTCFDTLVAYANHIKEDGKFFMSHRYARPLAFSFSTAVLFSFLCIMNCQMMWTGFYFSRWSSETSFWRLDWWWKILLMVSILVSEILLRLLPITGMIGEGNIFVVIAIHSFVDLSFAYFFSFSQ